MRSVSLATEFPNLFKESDKAALSMGIFSSCLLLLLTLISSLFN